MLRHEHELGIGGLPHREVRETVFAAGANDEVRIRDAGGVETRGQHLLVDVGRIEIARLHPLGKRLAGAHQFVAAAIVEGDQQRQARVGPGGILGELENGVDLGRQVIAPPDGQHADVGLVQLVEILLEEAAQQRHQARDLLGRAGPVLGGKAEDRKIADAQVAGGSPAAGSGRADTSPSTDINAASLADGRRSRTGPQTWVISCSFWLRIWSISATVASVSFCTLSDMDRLSSWLISPSFSRTLRSSMPSRRT